MASHYYLHPHNGSMWQQACQIWGDYVENETWTFEFIWTTFSDGARSHKTLKITITTDTGTELYFLILADSISSGGPCAHAPEYVGSRPGFTTVAPVKLPTYGARDTITDYNNHMHPIKSQTVYELTGRSVETSHDWYGAQFNGWWEVRTYVDSYFSFPGSFILIDQVWTQAGDIKQYGSAIPASPYMIGVTGSMPPQGGLTKADIQPLIDAVDNLSFIDQTFTINNGADMFTVRGRIRVS